MRAEASLLLSEVARREGQAGGTHFRALRARVNGRRSIKVNAEDGMPPTPPQGTTGAGVCVHRGHAPVWLPLDLPCPGAPGTATHSVTWPWRVSQKRRGHRPVFCTGGGSAAKRGRCVRPSARPQCAAAQRVPGRGAGSGLRICGGGWVSVTPGRSPRVTAPSFPQASPVVSNVLMLCISHFQILIADHLLKKLCLR